MGPSGYGPYESFDGIDLNEDEYFDSARQASESISEPLPPAADSCDTQFADLTAYFGVSVGGAGALGSPIWDGGSSGGSDISIGANDMLDSFEIDYTDSGGGQTSGQFYTHSENIECVFNYNWNDTEQRGSFS
jgi:hypothetical protein